MKAWHRIVLLARRILIWGIVLGGLMLVGTAGTVTYTSRSEFCNTCHIMEPYYESWKTSAHNFVDCVDCHFEPGLLETAEGKFKAVNQLAKYITRTEGTRPWAEVSDQSCMRSGCHSERLLSGPITFGRIKFDHRHHLLETRRGRQLRCTTCHSQIVQGEHMTVTTSACFLCHFRASEKSQAHGECTTCHGPPGEALEVAGRPFKHSDWTGRGVECVSCHRNVTRGQGPARKNRCSICHGEPRHIERFDDVEFIHENHITLHKVECDQCHDQIEHGLQERDHAITGGDCSECHQSGHSVQQLVRSGRGGAGVAEIKDRMWETRVDCSGCHREWFPTPEKKKHGFRSMAPATDVACMHCHGPSFGGMFVAWQKEVKSALEPLEAHLKRLDQAGGAGADAQALEDARTNIELVRADGSLGVHNIAYTIELLRKARDCMNEAGAALDPAFRSVELDIGLPKPLESTCGTLCHVDAARITGRFGKVRFHHRPHLTATDQDCGACHDEEKHGLTTVTGEDCKQCHHGKKEQDCGSCHDRETALLRGTVTVEGATLDMKHTMDKLACADCHATAEPKDLVAEVKGRCVECHDKQESFGTMLDQWREAMTEEVSAAAARLKAVELRLVDAEKQGLLPPEAKALFAKARECFEAAAAGPAHNVTGASSLLSAAGQFLDDLEKRIGR